MKTTKIGKHTVELYDSIEDLPILRFHKYNKMLLIDSGLGSDLTDIDVHIEKTISYMNADKKDEAVAELANLRKALYFVQMGLSPKHLAFAALVARIDGKETNDLSDDGLQKVVGLLSETTNKQLVGELDQSKKKIDSELQAYFPAMFDNAEVKEYYNLLKKRTDTILRNIIEHRGADEWQNVEQLTNDLLTFTNPPKFDGADNIEITTDRQFESMCLMLAQHLNIDARKYTVLAFYNAFEYLKELLKKQSKSK